ncbi:hypothetical protein D3C81_1326270 [compost metagenome]
MQGKGLLQVTKLGGCLGAVVVDLVDAVVEPGADVGVEGLQRVVECGVELRHLVAAGREDALVRGQLQVLALAVGGLPLPAHVDLIGHCRRAEE